MPQPPEARPWREAAGWLALLGPLFFISYGWANAMAAERSGVGSVVFAWEHAIPFVPWTILPYWSIDLFYAASLFVCSTRAELRTHVSRLVAVQCISVACFLIWPLRFGFERPQADGLWGALFTALAGSVKLSTKGHRFPFRFLWWRCRSLGRIWLGCRPGCLHFGSA